MVSLEKKVTYFEEAGGQNTTTLLRAVKEYTIKEGIENIVIASTTGKTGAEAVRTLKGMNIVVVAHAFGFREPGKNEMEEQYRKAMSKGGAKILVGTHALSSVERAIRKDFGTIQPLELIANVLRRLGEGTKVCTEITLMAADAGMIPIDKDIIAIAGTGRGADTALVIRPANSAKFFELKIKEVIAKPREF